MNSTTEKLQLQGAAGVIEALRDAADTSPTGKAGQANQRAPRGVAVIAHPHPLFGGTMDNKVVQTMARAFVQAGFTAVRFNFRGVGASAGTYDEGRSETQDMLAVIAQTCPVGTPLCIAGFSFGSFVASHVITALARMEHAQTAIEKIVLVGTAASRFAVAPIPAELHERTLVIHGEADDTVPLASVMDWARPQLLPVTVVPAGGHFFHGQLPLLKSLVLRHLC